MCVLCVCEQHSRCVSLLVSVTVSSLWTQRLSTCLHSQVITGHDGRRMWIQPEEDLHGAKRSGETWQQSDRECDLAWSSFCLLWWKTISISLALRAAAGTGGVGEMICLVTKHEHVVHGLLTAGYIRFFLWNSTSFGLLLPLLQTAKFLLSNILSCGKSDWLVWHTVRSDGLYYIKGKSLFWFDGDMRVTMHRYVNMKMCLTTASFKRVEHRSERVV